MFMWATIKAAYQAGKALRERVHTVCDIERPSWHPVGVYLDLFIF